MHAVRSTMGAPTLSFDELVSEDSDLLRRAMDASWYAETSMGKAVLRYHEVNGLLRDPRFRNMGTDVLARQGIVDGPIHDTYKGFLLAHEGEEHERLRGVLHDAFTPRSVDLLRSRIGATLHALLDRCVTSDHFDFVADVAEKFPAQVFAQLLGIEVSLDDRQFWRRCQDLGFLVGFEVRQHAARIEAAVEGLRRDIEPVMAARRAEPRDDLISALVSDSSNGRLPGDVDLVYIIVCLIFGGLDTTRRTFGKALVVLLEHPEQWRALCDQPSLAVSATEEILRYSPGTRVAVRVAREDLELNGVPLRRGELVFAATGAANRDPRAYAEPDTFDIRRHGPPPLSFGAGPHHCLGAHLARVELQEALPILADRLDGAELAGPVTLRSPRAGSPGPLSIPLRCRVKPR